MSRACDPGELRERLAKLTREIARLRSVGHELGETMRPDLANAAHNHANELEREADQLTALLFHQGPVRRPYDSDPERVQQAAVNLINREIDAAYWRHDLLRELARDKADEALAGKPARDLFRNRGRIN